MCYQPITIRYDSFFRDNNFIEVPCGKCFECLKKRQNDWQIRLSWEFDSSNYIASFFTLTYAEEKVPYQVSPKSGELFRTLYPKHITDFCKRFRKYLSDCHAGLEKKFRYFIAGEYGKLGRPHYHGIIFGIPHSIVRGFLLRDWSVKYGFIQCRPIKVNDGCFRYTAKYCCKGQFDYYRKHSDVLLKPKIQCSRGIGKSFLTPSRVNFYKCCDFKKRFLNEIHPITKAKAYNPAFLDLLVSRAKCSCSGSPEILYSLPKYYRQKLFHDEVYLRANLQDYLYSKSFQSRVVQSEQLQAERNCSQSEAFYIMDCETACLSLARMERAKESLVKFYKKQRL